MQWFWCGDCHSMELILETRMAARITDTVRQNGPAATGADDSGGITAYSSSTPPRVPSPKAKKSQSDE